MKGTVLTQQMTADSVGAREFFYAFGHLFGHVCTISIQDKLGSQVRSHDMQHNTHTHTQIVTDFLLATSRSLTYI